MKQGCCQKLGLILHVHIFTTTFLRGAKTNNMGINLKTYFLYQLEKHRALLIRANRPGYNNAKQSQAIRAAKILDAKVDLLLKKYLEHKKYLRPIYIGQFQGLPEGNLLYKKHGTHSIKNLRYAQTSYSNNCIFVAIANHEEAFLDCISQKDFADNGLTTKDIHLPSIPVNLTDFVTENDFDLSSIPHAYTYDLEDNNLQ